MICKQCAEAGRINRIVFDKDLKIEIDRHPKNCGCPCMHKEPQEWEKYFSCPQPGKAT